MVVALDVAAGFMPLKARCMMLVPVDTPTPISMLRAPLPLISISGPATGTTLDVPLVVAYHDACHLAHAQKVRRQPHGIRLGEHIATGVLAKAASGALEYVPIATVQNPTATVLDEGRRKLFGSLSDEERRQAYRVLMHLSELMEDL